MSEVALPSIFLKTGDFSIAIDAPFGFAGV
jgi:hypothetical protein